MGTAALSVCGRSSIFFLRLRKCRLGAASQHAASKRQDFQHLAAPELMGGKPQHSGPYGLILGVDYHAGVLVEAQHAAVLPGELLLRFHDDRFLHLQASFVA